MIERWLLFEVDHRRPETFGAFDKGEHLGQEDRLWRDRAC